MEELSKTIILRRAAVDGKDGTAGQGSFKSIVFLRSAERPAAPTGGSYTSPVPSGWSDGVPDDDGNLCWMSTRVFTSDGKSPQTSAWTTPQQLTDTADIDFCFSAKESPSTPPDTHPSQSTDDWHDTATEADIWMAVAKCSNGTWGDWEVTKIKGEKGEEGKQGEQGNAGTDGVSAWSVRLSPEVLSFTADANGTLDKASKTATASVYYGTVDDDHKATIKTLSVGTSTIGCTANKAGTTGCIIVPTRTQVGTTSKYIPATAGSANFIANVTFTDSNDVEHTATLEFSVPFTCDVSTSWRELIQTDTEITQRLTTVESTAETLTTSVSEINQKSDEIALMVKQSTSRNNLIANSWLNMVSNSYGETCVRSVQLTAGTTYILTVEGRIVTSTAKLRTYIHDAGWTAGEQYQKYVDITSTSLTQATMTFTPAVTGTYYIEFYNYSAKGYTSRYVHVRRVKLEVAQKVGDNYVATTWTESEQDVGTNNNLIKKIVFPDSETITGKDGSPVTAYKIKITSSTATYIDGGISNYPAGASSELTQLAAGEAYTLSFFAKASTATTIYSYLYGTTSAGTGTACQGTTNSDTSASPSKSGDGEWATAIGTEWQRVSITFTTKTSLPAGYQLLVARVNDSATVYITDVKLELGGRWTNNAATPDDLLATGIDIKKNLITLTADNFNVQNNAGERTASIDSDGNLTVPAVRTENKANSAGAASGYVVIRKNAVEAFTSDGFKALSLGVSLSGNGFIHIYNSAGRIAWGVDEGVLIDYSKGVMVSLSNLQYIDEAGFSAERLTTLVNAIGKASDHSTTIEASENSALSEAATRMGGFEDYYRYYAPTSADGSTYLKDDDYDLDESQTEEYNLQIFNNALPTNPVWPTDIGPSDITDRILFSIVPRTTTVDKSVTFCWTLYEVGVSQTSGNYTNKVSLLGELYCTVQIATT